MVGGGVGGTAIEGTTEQNVVANVTSSMAMSPETLLPRTASNTTCKEQHSGRHLSSQQCFRHLPILLNDKMST